MCWSLITPPPLQSFGASRNARPTTRGTFTGCRPPGQEVSMGKHGKRYDLSPTEAKAELIKLIS